MQSMMLDIVMMLPTIINTYIPGEIFWSPIGEFYQAAAFLTAAVCVIYSAVFALAGKYSDIPYVSEAVYMQVYQIEFM